MRVRMRARVLLVAVAAIAAGCTSEAPPEAFPSQQTFIPPPPPPSFPFAPMQAEANDFNGKYVAVNHVFGDELETTVLHSPKVRKLGNRDFLVGEIVWQDESPRGEKSKASNWLPIDTVDSMVVFENKDQALKEAVGPDGQKM
jgi:hypothetical protein